MRSADRDEAAALVVLVALGLVQLGAWGIRWLRGEPWPNPRNT
jgi:hypothetical protein